jgi:signal transduction histidine kinase
MTNPIPLEDLIQQTVDRLARQEQRMEALEASIHGTVTTSSPFLPLSLSASSTETPPEITWPRRESPTKRTPSQTKPDRIEELEQRLREAEERLQVAARLETVGRLVAGVSHDFHNLLTVIVGYADAIHSGLPAGHHLRETSDLIASTAQTAARITRQLVSLGRSTEPDPCPVDANMSVRAIERTLRQLTGQRLALEFHPAAALPLIHADPGQFDQVMLNLVVNARDAIPADGTITIRTAATTVAAARPGWPDDVRPGEYVALTVTDTGHGMTEDVLARVFDLFFTTKGERGMGIGLANVRDIVRAAGGHIEIESSPGWGTSVRVFWPVFPEPATPVRLRCGAASYSG